MRIVCQKCEAAYAIDDKFVTPKGVRAQCPRCRNLQLVKRDEGKSGETPAGIGAPAYSNEAPTNPGAGVSFDFSAPAPGAPPNAPAFDFGAPPPPPPVDGGFDFGAAIASAPPPPVRPQAEPPEPQFDFNAPPPPGPAPSGGAFDLDASLPPPPGGDRDGSAFDFDAPQLRPQDPPPGGYGPPPGAFAPPPPVGGFPPAPEPDLKLPPPPPAPSAPTQRASAPGFPGARPSGPAVRGVTCATCGKPLADAFDQALGTCDSCREAALDSAPSGVTPSGDHLVEHIDVAPRPRTASQPEFPPRPTAAELHAVRSALAAGRERRGGGAVWAVVGGLLVVALVGGFLYVKKPWVKRRPPTVRTVPEVAASVDSMLQQWSLLYPELEGESASASEAYVMAGEELLLKDTTQGYVQARAEFQKALVLDASNDRAVAGWALALAFGLGADIDEATALSTESMLVAAEQRSGKPRAYAAHAHLMLARAGNSNDIVMMAERGRSGSDPIDQALSSLAIGQAMMNKNAQTSKAAFDEMRKAVPDLRRGYYFQAMLAASRGEYKEAISQLEKRQSLDADQFEVAEALARLYVDVGEPARAKKALEAAVKASANSARPRLMLAVLSYQHLDDLDGAEAQLATITRDSDTPNRVLADAWAHLAAVQRLLEVPDEAEVSIARGLELSPEHVPTKLQQFLVALDKGVTSQARLVYDGLKGKLGDANLEATLAGRLLMAEARNDEALQVLSKAAQADPRRADALLLAGAAAARARNDGKAWEHCLKKGLKLDPHTNPVPTMTPLYVRPADLLPAAKGAYTALSNARDEDPNPVLCEGLVAWFSGDFRAADKHFARVNAIDAQNADALAYRTFGALRRKELAAATSLGARAQKVGRTNGNAHLASGAALLAAKKYEAAKRDLVKAQGFNAVIFAPRVLLGDIEAVQKAPDEARTVLTRVLLSDPTYRDAKRVLYRHGL